MKRFPFVIGLSLAILAACTPSVPTDESASPSSSMPSVAIASSSSVKSLSAEGKNAAWMKNFSIDVHIGDSLYGLAVTSIDQPDIHLRGDAVLSGTLEWSMFYTRPALFFIPDAEVAPPFERRFLVVNPNFLPVRQGAKANVTVNDMVIVFMESNKPSTITLRDVEIVGEPYETISENDGEWQNYLKLQKEAETDSSITL